jgi:hypothetical protein
LSSEQFGLKELIDQAKPEAISLPVAAMVLAHATATASVGVAHRRWGRTDSFPVAWLRP